MKYLLTLILLSGIIALSGCDNSSNRTQKKKSSRSSQKTSDVGVADAADYATGMTQISTMKKSEKKLEDIYANNKKQKEEASKDKK